MELWPERHHCPSWQQPKNLLVDTSSEGVLAGKHGLTRGTHFYQHRSQSSVVDEVLLTQETG